MKRFRWLLSRKWLVIPPIVLGLGTFLFFSSRRQELPRQEVEAKVSVQVERLAAEPLQPSAIGYGTAQPSRRWTAVAEVQGRITYLHPQLDSGHLVSQGVELLRIDDVDYRLRLSQRQADYDAAVARMAELRASQRADQESLKIEESLLKVIEADLRRFESLSENRAVAESEFEQARQAFLRQTQAVQSLTNALSLYDSRIASAQASVDLAQARLAEAKRDIDRTVIRSPFAGRLAGVQLELDQFVTAGERLFEIQDSQVTEIEAQFSLAQLDELLQVYSKAYGPNPWNSVQFLTQLGADVVVRSGNVSISYAGRPVRFSEQVDPQTRTRGIVVQIENSSEMKIKPGESDENMPGSSRSKAAQLPPLLPGAFCEVRLQGPAVQGVVTVPRTALEGEYVFVVSEESGEYRLNRTSVRWTMSHGDRVAIREGLEAGDLIAVQPPLPAIDGQLVEPIEVAGASNEQQTDAATLMGEPKLDSPVTKIGERP